MKEGFNSLISNNVVELIDPPPNSNIVGGTWQVKQKLHGCGNNIKYKLAG